MGYPRVDAIGAERKTTVGRQRLVAGWPDGWIGPDAPGDDWPNDGHRGQATNPPTGPTLWTEDGTDGRLNLAIQRKPVTIVEPRRGRSSAGRAPGLQPGGRGFESPRLHCAFGSKTLLLQRFLNHRRSSRQSHFGQLRVRTPLSNQVAGRRRTLVVTGPEFQRWGDPDFRTDFFVFTSDDVRHPCSLWVLRLSLCKIGVCSTLSAKCVPCRRYDFAVAIRGLRKSQKPR